MVQIHLKFESVFTWLLRGVCHRNSIGPKTCGPQTFRVSGYTQGYEKKSTFKSDPFTKVSFEFGLPSQLFHHVEFLDQGWVFKVPRPPPHKKKDPGEEPSTRQLELTDWAQTPMCVQLSLAHPQYWPVKYTTSSPWSKQKKSWTEGAKSQTQSITAISHVKHVRAPQKRTRLTNIHQPCSSCTVCTHVQKGI